MIELNLELNAIYVIVARELKKFLREKSRFIASLARPLIWLFMVGAGLSRIVSPRAGMPYTQFIFPGILGMTILFSSIFSSISVIWDKEFGFLKEILVAPVSRSSIVIGKALSGTVVSFIQAAIILLFFPLLGMHLTLGQVMLALFISAAVAFSISAFGIVLASFYESYESFSVIMNFIIMPMFFLSGAMYPVRLLQTPLRVAASVNPLTYGIDAIKNALFTAGQGPMGPDFSLGLDIGVVLASSVLFVVLASRFFERRA